MEVSAGAGVIVSFHDPCHFCQKNLVALLDLQIGLIGHAVLSVLAGEAAVL